MLLDPEVGIVSLGGRAGTGKSAMALCAGLEAVMERRQHKKVGVFRPLFAVGGQELGYLPGSEQDKMAPWAQAVFDTLGAVVSDAVIEEVLDRGMLELRARNGELLTIYVPESSSAATRDRFHRLWVGDYVRLAGEALSENRIELLAFR